MDPVARHQLLLSRIDRLPALPPACPPGDVRLDVASLALDGYLLGLYGGIYPPDGQWWARTLEAVARYARVPAPAIRRENLDEALDADPYRDDSPLTDAVLRLARRDGVDTLTLADVARGSGRDEDWIVSMYGSVDGLVEALLARTSEEAFDELVPLSAEPTGRTVHAALLALASSQRTSAMLRHLVLSGVELSRDAVARTGSFSPAVLEAPHVTDQVLVAVLALDAWSLGSSARGYPWPDGVADAVVEELRALVTPGAPATSSHPGPDGAPPTTPGA